MTGLTYRCRMPRVSVHSESRPTARGAIPMPPAIPYPPGLSLRSRSQTMSHKHENLLRAIFHDPVSGNIQWREIESLLNHLGASSNRCRARGSASS